MIPVTPYERALLEAKRKIVLEAFQDAAGKQTRARAGLLGVHRDNLDRRLNEPGIRDQAHRASTPPSIGPADLLLRRLLSPLAYEAVLGDLEEAYRKRLARNGKQGADRWYKQQVFETILSFLWDACRRWARPGRRKQGL